MTADRRYASPAAFRRALTDRLGALDCVRPDLRHGQVRLTRRSARSCWTSPSQAGISSTRDRAPSAAALAGGHPVPGEGVAADRAGPGSR